MTDYTPPSNNPGTPGTFTTGTGLQVGTTPQGQGHSINMFHRFTMLSGLFEVNINTANLLLFGVFTDDGTPDTLIAADDQAAPLAPTTNTEHDDAVRTTTKIPWVGLGLSTSAFTASPECKTLLQEVVDSHDPSAIQILHDDNLKIGSANRSRPSSYDDDTAEAAKLDFDFTEVAVTDQAYGFWF